MTLVSQKELATTDKKDIRVYDINTTKCLYTLFGHNEYINDLKVLDNGETLLSGGFD